MFIICLEIHFAVYFVTFINQLKKINQMIYYMTIFNELWNVTILSDGEKGTLSIWDP